MPYNIQPNQLTPYDIAIVKGTLAPYSHLARIVEGQALIAENERRRQHGINIKIDRPYTSATVFNASIVPNNPQNFTILEQYITERFFTRQSADLPGNNYEARNTGKFMPAIYVKQPDGHYKQIAIDRELAGNQPCMLVLRVFKAQPNNGVSLIAVLLEEEPKFVEVGQRWIRDLAQRGLVLEPTDGTSGIIPEGSPQESAVFAQTQNLNIADIEPNPQYTQQTQPQPAYQQPQQQPAQYAQQPAQQATQPWNPTPQTNFPPANATVVPQPTAVAPQNVPTDGIFFNPNEQ